MSKPRVTLVYAVDQQNGIGYENKLPWAGKLPSDMKRFRELTMGHAVIMGRKTHESIGKPLVGRLNVVLSGLPGYAPAGCNVRNSFERALYLLRGREEVFVIGGKAVYATALPYADRLHRTEIAASFEADTHFPILEDYPQVRWEEPVEIVSSHAAEPPDQYGYRVVTQDRARPVSGPRMGRRQPMVDPTYAKTDEYGQVLQEILDRGVCPFCPEHFQWHPNPILHHLGDWFITRSIQPYEHTQEHFMLIRTQHAEHIAELTSSDWARIGELCGWAAARFDLLGGGITLRWGNPAYTGATVRHLHAHLIIPEINPATGRAYPVSFPIG